MQAAREGGKGRGFRVQGHRGLQFQFGLENLKGGLNDVIGTAFLFTWASITANTFMPRLKALEPFVCSSIELKKCDYGFRCCVRFIQVLDLGFRFYSWARV